MCDILVNRVPRETQNQSEIEALRTETRDLKRKITRLQAERDRLAMPPPISSTAPPVERDGQAKKSPLDLPSTFGEDMEVDLPHDETPKVVMPPRAKWPPAIRPAIKGKRKVLPDDPIEVTPRRKDKDLPKSKSNPKETLEDKFSEFMSRVNKQMQDMFETFMSQCIPEVTTKYRRPDRSVSASSTKKQRNRSVHTDASEREVNRPRSKTRKSLKDDRKASTSRPPKKPTWAQIAGQKTKKKSITPDRSKTPVKSGNIVPTKSQRKPKARKLRVSNTSAIVLTVSTWMIR